jgi:hypothetical protein
MTKFSVMMLDGKMYFTFAASIRKLLEVHTSKRDEDTKGMEERGQGMKTRSNHIPLDFKGSFPVVFPKKFLRVFC